MMDWLARGSARFWLALALAYMCLIWFLSSRSNLNALLPPLFPHADKLIHIIEFGGLAFLWCQVIWRLHRPGAMRWRALLVFGLVSSYGALDEYHQSFVPGRSSGADDAIADALGAALCIAIWCLLFPTGRMPLAVSPRKS